MDVQLLVYGSSDKYSHNLALLKQVFREDGDPSIHEYIEHYRHLFKTKQLSCLYLLKMKIDPVNGQMDVLMNEYGENPLKTRLEINAAAAPEQKASIKIKRPTLADGWMPDPLVFTTSNTA